MSVSSCTALSFSLPCHALIDVHIDSIISIIIIEVWWHVICFNLSLSWQSVYF